MVKLPFYKAYRYCVLINILSPGSLEKNALEKSFVETKFPAIACKSLYGFQSGYTSCNTPKQMKSCDMYYRIKLKKFCLEFQTMGLVMYRSNIVPSVLMKLL